MSLQYGCCALNASYQNGAFPYLGFINTASVLFFNCEYFKGIENIYVLKIKLLLVRSGNNTINMVTYSVAMQYY